MSSKGLAVSVLYTATALLLVPATLLIGLRQVTPPWSRAVELVALAPLALPLASAALLLALSAIPLTVRRRRWVAGGLAGLAGLVALATGVAVGPLFAGARPAPAGPESLVVMAQNAEHGDPAALAAVAREGRADVLVLTEASAALAVGLRDTALLDELGYSVGLRPDGTEGSVVLSRYPLSLPAEITAGGESRVVSVATPRLGKVDVIALHPRPPYETDAWLADYRVINDYLEFHYAGDAGREARPAVIAGDLNATLDHAPLRRIRALGFRDAVEQLNLGFQPTWPAAGTVQVLGRPVPPIAPIDHVLASPALVAQELTMVHVLGADHLGLCVELRRAGR